MKYRYFQPARFSRFAKWCFRTFASGEPGVVLFAPKTDKVRRINQLIQDYSSSAARIIRLDLVPHLLEGREDVEFYLVKYLKQKKKKTWICISNTEVAIIERNFSLIDDFVEFAEAHPSLGLLFFSEVDLTHPEIVRQFRRTHIFSRVLYYPLYDKEDTLAFVAYLEHKWQMSVPLALKADIVRQCGGQFWLVKQAIRTLRDNPKITREELWHSEFMKLRLEQIYLSFLSSEQKVMTAFITHAHITEDFERHSFAHLTAVGLVKDKKITIPLLEEYVRKRLPAMRMELRNHHIFVNSVRLDAHFSRHERRTLAVLLEKKPAVVGRDTVARALWPFDTETHYSDWAIDRLIARLRWRLVELGFAKDVIASVRGKGYVLTV